MAFSGGTTWCEELRPMEFSGIKHAISWSIFDWLMKTNAIRLSKLIDKSSDWKNKPSAATSIEEVFGVSPYVLHERWRKYGLENYKR